MAALADVMVGKLHRDSLALFERVVDDSVILLQVHYDSLSHIGELRDNLLRLLVYVVFFLDFLA